VKPTYFFLFLFLITGSLFAEIDSYLETQGFYHLPEGSQIQFKFEKDINVAPGHNNTYLPNYEEDADGDGIADKLDWCPNTPKGEKVWTKERIKAEKQPDNFLGCSFAENSKETWLSKENSGPKGSEYGCALYFPGSTKYRYFAKNSIFTVKGKTTLTNKEFYSTYFPGYSISSPEEVQHFLTLKTKSGLEFLLKCTSGYSSYEKEYGGDKLIQKFYARATIIKQLNNYFILSNIPKPEVIGRK
jgi:hypothetical protein